MPNIDKDCTKVASDMKTKEFDLSKRITDEGKVLGVINIEDVKEFIRLFEKYLDTINGGNWTAIKFHILKNFRKLAGEKLK